MGNVYNTPEEYGLEQAYHIDIGESYEFNKLCIWRHKNGTLYMASDAGCSCPSPFEDYNSLEDLEVATPEGVREWFERNRRYTNAGDQADALKVFEPPTWGGVSTYYE